MPRWVLLGMLMACSSARREPAPPPPVPAPADAAPVTVPDAAVANGPPQLVRPAGCTLRGRWRGEHELALAPGARPYATAFSVERAEVTLADSVFAEVATRSLRLAGFVDASRLQLHPTRAFTVAGWLAPGPRAALQLVGVRGDRIALDLAPPSSVTAAAPARVDDAACGDLALERTGKFGARDAIDAPTERKALLRANRTIPLSREPAEPPVATLRYDTSPNVDVLERRGEHVRVAILPSTLNPRDEVVVFGWVPASAVFGAPRGAGGSWADGGGLGIGGHRPRRDTRFVTCATEIALAVEHGGARNIVGAIAPQVVIEILPGDDDLVEVRLYRVQAVLAEGARWLVEPAALADCTDTTRP